MSEHRNNILVLTYWSYNDALIQTYTLPYVRMMAEAVGPESRVFLLTLDKMPPQGTDVLPPNCIHLSVPYQPVGRKGVIMWIRTLWMLKRLIHREKIETLHCWCTPAGMIGYILSKLTGRKLIIDSYEPHAEAMVENGSWKRDGRLFRLLFRFEKLQSKRAVALIAATEGMRDYALKKYGVSTGSFYVKPACVDLELFSFSNRKKPELLHELGLENKLICVYAGKFGGIYLDREVFAFFAAAQQFWGDRFHALLLTNHDHLEVENWCRETNFDSSAMTLRFVRHQDIADYMGLADFGITPVKPVPTKRYCTPIKNGEYWALGLPVVTTPGISDDSEIIAANKIGCILAELSPDGYAKTLAELNELLEAYTIEAHYQRIRPIAERYRNFESARAIYRELYGKPESVTDHATIRLRPTE